MPKADKIRCLGCGRRVTDDPQAKASHILKYHPQTPFKRVAGLFNPQLFEWLGYRIGEHFKQKGWV